PKPGDPRLAHATATVIGGRGDAMAGAVREAESRGYTALQLEAPVTGEARAAGVAYLGTAMARAAALKRPACIVASGETTVRVAGRGKGGRNQELVLATVEMLSTIRVPVVVASTGTDGIDGPTDAAGAIADSSTHERARTAGVGPPDRYLANN